MLLLNHKLNWRNSYYKKLNIGEDRTAIDEELVSEIEKRNKVDLELYRILKGRFLKEVSIVILKLQLLKAAKKLKRIMTK